ncbi:uncharacterized protein LOC100377696 [Saccoglossus kowalevskii]|uniref:Uncharacterized protein LOC100377696 n=1 Tax=Saccoglossus kowalevskii TaxID=10224 RepID=A0ABM0GXZ5_SACKO|nr:PREDICTED: uncharacterized protein LOC100377696 [Saccoglossus kowalevskii]
MPVINKRKRTTTHFKSKSDVNFPNDGHKIQIRAEGSSCKDHYLQVNTSPESKTTVYGRDAFRCNFGGAYDDKRTLFRWYQVPDPDDEHEGNQHQSAMLGMPGKRIGHGDCIFILVANWPESNQKEGEKKQTVYAMKLDYKKENATHGLPPWPDLSPLKEKIDAARFNFVYIESSGQFLIRDYVAYRQEDTMHRYISANYEGTITRRERPAEQEDPFNDPLMCFHITLQGHDKPYRDTAKQHVKIKFQKMFMCVRGDYLAKPDT